MQSNGPLIALLLLSALISVSLTAVALWFGCWLGVGIWLGASYIFAGLGYLAVKFIRSRFPNWWERMIANGERW